MKRFIHDIVKDKWQYEILKNEGEGIKGYGYTLIVYKNGKEVSKQGAFGSVSIAESEARDYFLFYEFGIEREV